jgi:hypothetical protein
VAYHFQAPHRAVQPYVLGGMGILRTNYTTSTYVNSGSATESAVVGWGLNVGTGLRVFLTPAVSLRPEVTYINALWSSRENLSETRVSIAAGYHW